MMPFPRWCKPALAVVAASAALVLVGCSTPPPWTETSQEPDKLYADAKADLANGSWDRAIKGLQSVEARTTGTLLGQQVMLELAYAQWRGAERAGALSTLDRFIKLHPSSPALDYALYLRGMVNFNDNLGIFGDLSGQQLSERDQRASRDAYQSFAQLAQQFPTSKYTADARVRMDYIVNSLAMYEVHVARYYFRRGAYVAAANRARQTVTEFEQAPATEEALAIMVLSYDRLGLTDLRDAADRVLRKNFPNSRYVEGRDLADHTARAWWRFW